MTVRKRIALGVGGMLVLGLLAPSNALAGPILESAERLAVAAAMQSDDARVRSSGRTWAGVTMLAAGGIMAAYYGSSSCASNRAAGILFDVRSCGEAGTMTGIGIGLAVTGVLYATIWSDVPANRSIDLRVDPGRIAAGKTFGW